MAKVKGKDFEQLGARVPKEVADKLKKHAKQLRMTFTDVMVLALQRYMASPESRLAVVEAKLQRAESELNSLRSYVGEARDHANKKTVEGPLAALDKLVSPK